MTDQKKQFGWKTIVILTVFLLIFLGCEKQGPFSPINSQDSSMIFAGDLHFIPLGNGPVKFDKVITRTQTISSNSGGTVELEYEQGNNLSVKITFEVLSNSITQTSDITIGLNTSHLGGMADLSFGPSGLSFNPPALVNFETEGLNLNPNHINTDSLAFYYVDTNGDWIEMPCDTILVDIADGEINVVNAEIPHFSRYAVAFSR